MKRAITMHNEIRKQYGIGTVIRGIRSENIRGVFNEAASIEFEDGFVRTPEAITESFQIDIEIRKMYKDLPEIIKEHGAVKRFYFCCIT